MPPAERVLTQNELNRALLARQLLLERARLSLPRAVFGDNLLADIRIGPDGRLYQLGSSPVSGVSIYRYSLEQS